MASITEVARLAGVSAATASRVVSASHYPVSAATRERVLEAARTLDYVPNALARGLLKSRVPVVAVIVHDITDPYFSEVVRGVEDAASAAGYLVITCSSERDADREAEVVRLLRSIRAAAVVFAGSGLDDPVRNDEMDRHLAAMRADGAAIVHLSPHAHGEPEVGVDNAAGLAAMVGALVGLGHRRIAFLAGPSSLFVARERLAGYRQGLEAAGIPYDERLVVRSSFDAGGGALGVDVLLDAGVTFTAIACANDLLALGALQRLAALGIAVPGAVSVAGFDDISTAALTAPSLSTVRLPLRELGRRGFAHADAVLRGDPAVPQRLPTTVILRDSTAAPAPTVPAPATAVPAVPARSAPAPRRPRRLMAGTGTGALAGRVVLVTGGSRGIGAEVAVKAAAEGARVAVHYHRSPDGAERTVALARELGAEAEAFPADVRDGSEVEALVAGVIERFGRVDGLVNNAGRTLVGPFLETTVEDWEDVLRTDLSAAFHTCRAVLPSMLERGDGSIVNIASRLGQMGIAETAAYSTAKAGLIGLTRSLAREFGPRGVRVNAVAPGPTVTDMTTDLLDSDEGRRRLRDMPLGRFGRADEVADAVIFLLSDRASLFLGQTLNPNAGGYMP